MADITINHDQIKRMQSKLSRALEMTADAIMGDLRERQTIPRDLGTLQGEAMSTAVLELGQAVITNDAVYARRLYFHPEYNFSTAENANAGALWFVPYMSGGERHAWVLEAFAKMCKRVGL